MDKELKEQILVVADIAEEKGDTTTRNALKNLANESAERTYAPLRVAELLTVVTRDIKCFNFFHSGYSWRTTEIIRCGVVVAAVIKDMWLLENGNIELCLCRDDNGQTITRFFIPISNVYTYQLKINEK